jgi:tetratricopeptide (TPR) repeat protein
MNTSNFAKIMKNNRLIIFLGLTLFSSVSYSQLARTEINIYNPVIQPGKDMRKVKEEITNMLTIDKASIGRTIVLDKKNNLTGEPTDILVLDDKIEFKLKNRNIIIYFIDIIDDEITAKGTNTISAENAYTSCYVELLLNNFVFSFEGPLWLRKQACSRFEEMKKYADDFYFIQYHLKQNLYKSQLALFDSIAAQYRELKVKPPVSEEQRRYIVQANYLNENKKYDQALETYLKATEINQTTYPTAYFNMALISALNNNFQYAIFNMKKYLILSPDAEDARSAQDKIYEWEAEIVK